jgi:hypothetical protein
LLNIIKDHLIDEVSGVVKYHVTVHDFEQDLTSFDECRELNLLLVVGKQTYVVGVWLLVETRLDSEANVVNVDHHELVIAIIWNRPKMKLFSDDIALAIHFDRLIQLLHV